MPAEGQQKRPGSLLWHHGTAAKKQCRKWNGEQQEERPALARNLQNPSTLGDTADLDCSGGLKASAVGHIMQHAAIFPGCVGPVAHTRETPTRNSGNLWISANRWAGARRDVVSGGDSVGSGCAVFSTVSPAVSPAVSPSVSPAASPAVAPAILPAVPPAVSPAASPAVFPALVAAVAVSLLPPTSSRLPLAFSPLPPARALASARHRPATPIKAHAAEEGANAASTTSASSDGPESASCRAESNGSASNLNSDECVPWCSDGASQSPSSHLQGAECAAHEAGCAVWHPEAAIPGLQHAAVFPCSFGPETGAGDNTHNPFSQLPVSHCHDVVPLPFNHPTAHADHVPSFAGLLNSISPASQLHRRVVSAPETSAVYSSCNLSVSPCRIVKEGLLPLDARAQQQEKENSGARDLCLVSFSGKTCVFNSPSMGSGCSQQQRQERQERRVQDLVAPGDALSGLNDELQSAARPGNPAVSANPTEGSEDDGDLEELQDTASS
ncbi:unnamed protein product [Closterium sp. Naga37s-1]|nr:unnamed protein product [Closterium sp. Naga37s-1]